MTRRRNRGSSGRVANTALAGGKIGKDKYRAFAVRGTSGFPGQGGKSGGCGIPESAVAVAASFTASGETATGRLTAYAYGAAAPTTTVLSYSKGVNITSSATVKFASAGVTPHLRVFNRAASTHLVVDVTGYFVPQIHAVIYPEGAVYGGSKRVLSATRLSAGSYRVTIDRDLTGCTPVVSVHGGPYFASGYESGSFVYATTYQLSGGSPVPTDLFWDLTVIC